MVKNEAANAGGGQMVKGLERFAIKFGLSPVDNGEPWTYLRKITLLQCGGGLLRRLTLWWHLCMGSLLFSCSRSQS